MKPANRLINAFHYSFLILLVTIALATFVSSQEIKADNKQINPILVGELPTGIAYNPKNNYIYLTNSGSNTVSVINANSNKQFASIALQDALRPIALAYNSDNGYIYVVNEESSTISVINGTSNKQIETIILPNETVTLENGTKSTLQPRPISITHNAANGGIYSQ
jgi:YVTN family beta-propeller protein